jgi:sec-independent protein translocase protein TatA
MGDLFTPTHLALVAIVALLIFGPRRLPEIGGAVGKTIREFQKSMKEARDAINEPTKEDAAKQGDSPSDGSRA